MTSISAWLRQNGNTSLLNDSVLASSSVYGDRATNPYVEA